MPPYRDLDAFNDRAARYDHCWRGRLHHEIADRTASLAVATSTSPSRVLDVVDSIPPGRVMSYGDIAEYVAAGLGPRQVGRVMSVYGGAVAWWRVIHSDGTTAPGHDSRALQHYLAEGTPLRSARPPVRVDMRRARWPGRDGSLRTG